MLVKILMCLCYREDFISEGNVWVKDLINFDCKSPEEHEYFVRFCKHHPFGKSIPSIRDHTGTDGTRCFCKIMWATEIASFELLLVVFLILILTDIVLKILILLEIF